MSCMHLTRLQLCQDYPTIHTIRDTEIEIVEFHKYRVIWLNGSLTFNQHVEQQVHNKYKM